MALVLDTVSPFSSSSCESVTHKVKQMRTILITVLHIATAALFLYVCINTLEKAGWMSTSTCENGQDCTVLPVGVAVTVLVTSFLVATLQSGFVCCHVLKAMKERNGDVAETQDGLELGLVGNMQR